jgi:hypothetical protein
MRTPIRLTVLASIALAAAFCGRTAPPGSAEPTEQAILVVDNQSTLQVTVYVLRDAQRQRLGIANALTTTRLRIPDSLVFGLTSLRFEVDPLGSRQTPISTPITVAPGEEVRLVIPSTLR